MDHVFFSMNFLTFDLKMIIVSFNCTMKGGFIFPVTSPYQAEAYDNLDRCPPVAQHFPYAAMIPQYSQ